MGVEYELKFAATADQQEAIRALMPDEGHKLKMKTTYFDAVDGGLSARRTTKSPQSRKRFSRYSPWTRSCTVHSLSGTFTRQAGARPKLWRWVSVRSRQVPG